MPICKTQNVRRENFLNPPRNVVPLKFDLKKTKVCCQMALHVQRMNKLRNNHAFVKVQ